MAKKRKTRVDIWLEKETSPIRKALENVSRHFDDNDALTVNTLEAIYGKESSFGVQQRKCGIDGAAGHFHLAKKTAQKYGLTVTKKNDQRFDINYASSAAARYLKDLNSIFGRQAVLAKNRKSIPVKSVSERKKFTLAAYNGGEGAIAAAQAVTQAAGKDPCLWDDVKHFLESARIPKDKAQEIRDYVENVLNYEREFAEKSLADKKVKNKKGKNPASRCTVGHWRTIDGRPVFICD